MPRAHAGAVASGRREGFSVQREWIPLALTYALAVVVRLSMWRSAPYGDEGMFFSVARRFWGPPERFDDIYNDPIHPYDPFLFFHRPFFHVLLSLPAHVSFDSYRLAHLLITSLLPVLCILILREARVRPLLAYPVATVIALHQAFVFWGVIAWPDSLMTTALAAAVWTGQRGWNVASAAAALAAVWTKETAYAALLFLLVWSLSEGYRAGKARFYPLRLERPQTAYLGAAIVAPVPIAVAMALGLGFPGGPTRDLYAVRLLDQFFLMPWLVLLVLLGLRWPRTRRLAALGLLYPLVFFVLHVMLHRGIELWYLVVPNFFALVAATAVLDEWWTRTRKRQDVLERHAPKAAAVLVAALFVVYLVVPHDAAPQIKAFAVRPLTMQTQDSLTEALDYQDHRDPDIGQVVALLDQRRPAAVFAPDVYFPMSYYPLAFHTGLVLSWSTGVTRTLRQDLDPWISALEQRTNLTVLQKLREPLNEAIREVYAPCLLLDTERYAVFDGPQCAGSGPLLREEYERRVREFEGQDRVLDQVSAWITDKSGGG